MYVIRTFTFNTKYKISLLELPCHWPIYGYTIFEFVHIAQLQVGHNPLKTQMTIWITIEKTDQIRKYAKMRLS